MAVSMGCVMDKIPFSYLGMPLRANPKRISTWDPVIRREKERLTLWRRKFLSFGRRVTLIKSILNSLPLYYLLIFKAPRSVIKKLEQLRRDFLWGWGMEKRRMVKVKWTNVCKPKMFGGLGISNIINKNTAMLAKWWWRFGVEKEAIWRKLIMEKYGSD
ncbi:hypothetical protein CRYUN_Cryun23aG0155400 [Craigia yunnanensis]